MPPPGVPVRATRLLLAFLAFALICAGCDSTTTLIDPDAPGGPGDDGDGTVQKAVLTVTVVLSGLDSTLAARIGSGGGVLRDAEVTVQRLGSPDARVDTTDADGVVRFEDLLPGRYDISAIRTLTPEELEALGAEGASVNAFAGALSRQVSAPATDLSVLASSGRRGSLVVSELYIGLTRLSGGDWYRYAQFIELYNNSDTTIYLDGKVLVRGMVHGLRESERFPCEVMAQWQNDPEGIWTQRFIERFPGAGREHPLPPGAVAVVALDAIDHSQYHPDLPDLSGADFEFTGPRDVDNPDVPDMITLGKIWGGGHGHFWNYGENLAFVAGPVNVDALPKEDLPGVLDPEHWRVPGEKILDGLAATPTPEREVQIASEFGPLCDRIVNERFDRQPAPIADDWTAMLRRTFVTLPDGRKVLQRTQTSSRDWIARQPPTPGYIPDG